MAFARSKTAKVYDEAALYEYAVAALARQMRSVTELRRLLRTRTSRQENAAGLVESVLARLIEQRYLNDQHFAATYSSYRKENERFGKLRVAQDLKHKGVAPETAAKALDAIYNGADEVELARAFLRRKRLRQPEDTKGAARIYRTLARAGYSTNAASAILKNWQVDDETITAFEEQRLESEENVEEGGDS